MFQGGNFRKLVVGNNSCQIRLDKLGIVLPRTELTLNSKWTWNRFFRVFFFKSERLLLGVHRTLGTAFFQILIIFCFVCMLLVCENLCSLSIQTSVSGIFHKASGACRIAQSAGKNYTGYGISLSQLTLCNFSGWPERPDSNMSF